MNAIKLIYIQKKNFTKIELFVNIKYSLENEKKNSQNTSLVHIYLIIKIYNFFNGWAINTGLKSYWKEAKQIYDLPKIIKYSF